MGRGASGDDLDYKRKINRENYPWVPVGFELEKYSETNKLNWNQMFMLLHHRRYIFQVCNESLDIELISEVKVEPDANNRQSVDSEQSFTLQKFIDKKELLSRLIENPLTTLDGHVSSLNLEHVRLVDNEMIKNGLLNKINNTGLRWIGCDEKNSEPYRFTQNGILRGIFFVNIEAPTDTLVKLFEQEIKEIKKIKMSNKAKGERSVP